MILNRNKITESNIIKSCGVLTVPSGARVHGWCLPEGRGELQRTDTGRGEAQRVSVGHLLDRAVKALDVVSLQNQNRLTGVHMNLKNRWKSHNSPHCRGQWVKGMCCVAV